MKPGTIYVGGCGLGPASPTTQKLVGRLHRRCEEIIRKTGPGEIRHAIENEMRALRTLMMDEYGIMPDGMYVTVTDGHSSERIDLP